jgi:response regulator RpfG family c-di-GMP phosphodiesterase
MGVLDDRFELAAEPNEKRPPWKVLIVDDEPEVHNVTRLVLSSFRFAERPLQLLSAYSSKEAEKLLVENDDTAVVLLDVVMETEQAGLDLVRLIRSTLGNHFVRIVLRTGQPGQAPEHEVIAEYDINDYKEKTELTAQKLATTLYSALRAYRDMRTIEASQLGLEHVLRASSHVFSQQHPQQFASIVLAQLADLVGTKYGALCCHIAHPNGALPAHFEITEAIGNYAAWLASNADERLPGHIVNSLRDAYLGKRHVFAADHYVLHFSDSHETEALLYVGQSHQLDDLGLRLMKVFCGNVAIAFENLHLNQELFDSQLEMVYLLAGAAETRSQETANHVRRVGIIAKMLGELHGLDDNTCELLNYAAPLHDIGKIGIPDAILNKPGAHTPEETTVMRTHAEIGAKLLGNSKRPLFNLAAKIALNHHENWDGSGYPTGLSGDHIPIEGRITALADVFDALGSRRCYKEAWPENEIREFIAAQRGKKFDPELVDLLLDNWDRIISLRKDLPDS